MPVGVDIAPPCVRIREEMPARSDEQRHRGPRNITDNQRAGVRADPRLAHLASRVRGLTLRGASGDVEGVHAGRHLATVSVCVAELEPPKLVLPP